MKLLFLLLGIIIGSSILYIYLKPQLKSIQELDKNIINQNEINKQISTKLSQEIIELSQEINSLTYKKEELKTSINDLREQAELSAESIYKKSYELANSQMEYSAEKMSQEYQKAKENAEQDYLTTLAECANDFVLEIAKKEEELSAVEGQLKEIKDKFNSAVEASKRAEELKNQKDFYRLQLSDLDIQEINKLREVVPYLRDSEPLNKVIWKVYYEKPYTDLIGRVIGNGIYSGIYKITNIENQMCYVGQAVNISDRWKQHIKRGIGAETATKNKLYPAMLEYGVENFTFEIIEKCDKKLLNEREDYWQDFFHAKDFGYSIK